MKKSNDINAQLFYALKVSEKSRVPFLFISAPGWGKTTSVELFAKINGYKLEVLRGNSTSESEVMGYDVVDTVHPESKTTVHLRPSWFSKVLENHENGLKSILFLDEITTCPDHVQAALLHLIFERKVGSESIPEDTLIVSAGNYQQCLGNSFQLMPPLMNRFCIINIVPDKDDFDVFLSRYQGASLGTMVDFFEDKKETFTKMTANSLSYNDHDLSIVSEYIERGVLETTKMLVDNKSYNPRVNELDVIYSDTIKDSILKGFITPRTTNYLRDVTIAAFLSFGREGIYSENFRNMIEGLVGIAPNRKPNGELSFTSVAENYFTSLQTIITDVEKLNNNKLPEYEKFFASIAGDSGTKTVKPEQIVAFSNKLNELCKDAEMRDIPRPVAPETLTMMLSVLISTVDKIAGSVKLNADIRISNICSPEKLAGLISNYNSIIDLISSMRTLVSDPIRDYKDATKDEFSKKIDSLRTKGYAKFNALSKLMGNDVPGVVLPDVHIVTK